MHEGLVCLSAAELNNQKLIRCLFFPRLLQPAHAQRNPGLSTCAAASPAARRLSALVRSSLLPLFQADVQM